jgi:polyhydroxyalkanoate synthesis regulator protein
MVPSYLQVSLETLTREQDRFRKQFANAFTPQGALEAYQEQARKNLAMFEQAMAMFSPFGAIKGGAVGKPGEEPKKPEAAKSPEKPAEKPQASSGGQASEIAELKAQLASIQSQLEKLSSDRQ